MANTKFYGLTKNNKALYEAVSKFKSVAFPQLPYFLTRKFKEDGNDEMQLVNYLTAARYASKLAGALNIPSLTAPDTRQINSLWVAIDIVKDDEEPCEALTYAFKGNNANVCLFHDKQYFITSLELDTDFAVIDALNSVIEASDGIGNAEYIFVISDMALAENFNLFEPHFPFKVALIKGNVLTETPSIEYFEKNE